MSKHMQLHHHNPCTPAMLTCDELRHLVGAQPAGDLGARLQVVRCARVCCSSRESEHAPQEQRTVAGSGGVQEGSRANAAAVLQTLVGRKLVNCRLSGCGQQNLQGA